MIRKTLTILSLIGLLLSVGLWGMGSCYSLAYISETYTVGVEDCAFVLSAYARGSVRLDAIPADDFGWYWTKRRTAWFRMTMPQFLDFRPAGGVGALKLPLWIPTLAFAIGSINFILIPLHRRRKRKKLGLCVKCGYDLRGSEERCPECGTEFETT